MKIEQDYYKILSYNYDEYYIKQRILDSFETELEIMANKEGYSYKYTIINGKVYRRSLFENKG